MAARTLNYTGRQRLRRAHTRFYLREDPDGTAAFDAVLSLRSYGLPASALVAVEAYRQTTWMRFSFGTIGSIKTPPDRRLTHFGRADAVRFRVRVTSADKHGLLLAAGDRIPPAQAGESDDDRIPLLSVMSDDDLGQLVYRVDYDDRPILLINARVGDWRALARAPAFVSMVIPGVVREVLREATREEPDEDDPDSWEAQWLRFATLLPGMGDPPVPGNTDATEQWIEEALSAFARQHQLMERLGEYWKGE